jgi:hypothetical protein
MPTLKPIILALALALSPPACPPLAAQEPPPPEALRSALALPWASQQQSGRFEDWLEYMENGLGPDIPDWLVHSTVVHYSARKPRYDSSGLPVTGADGRPASDPIPQSARIFFPPSWRAPKGHALPLVIYCHATTLRKHGVASEFGGHEWMLGAAAAAYYGFAVAMPDQAGMGADTAHDHPFCHAQSLAYSTLDGIPAMRSAFTEDPFLLANHYTWDGRLFLVGYSEGAYAALAATRELQAHPEDYASMGGAPLSGSACMAGPFNLSELSRADMINPLRETDHCFYLPYVIRGYHAVYGDLIDPLQIFAPVLLESRADGNIMDWTDGSRNGLTVDALIAGRLGVPSDRVVIRNLFNPVWLTRELDDPGYEHSVTHQLLRDNDLDRGWAPATPILFAQSPGDRDLAPQNTTAILGNLAAEIAKSGRDPHRLVVFKQLGDCPVGISHLEGALVGIPLAFQWIYDGMPMD